MVTTQSTAGRRYTPGPGKTTPRLIEDLLDYNPNSKPAKNGKNLLADPAWQRIPQNALAPPRTTPNDCRHSLMWKTLAKEEGLYPRAKDELPDINSKYNVDTYCYKCRYHFQIRVSFAALQKDGAKICQMNDSDNPLHHLRLTESVTAKAWEEKVGEAYKYDPLQESHRFVCTAQKCPAEVEIRITIPRLPVKMLVPITDKARLFQRGQAEINTDPERYAETEPTPVHTALGYLRRYIIDALACTDTDEIRKIAKRNKKYMLVFANECDALLEYIGFTTIEGVVDPELGPNYFWRLPVVTDQNRQFLTDVISELELHIRKYDPVQTIYQPLPALVDIQKSLGFYDFMTKSRTINLDGGLEHPYYASLGACESFTDDLLGWAYDRQRKCDPQNRPYYFDCLKDLANGRNSSDLQTKVVMAESSGEVGLNEIMEAYKFFGVDINTVEGDDHIIGTYKSRIQSAPRQKDDARAKLLTIAKHRGSTPIEKVAKDKTMSYEEALEFMNVTSDTASDGIEAAAVVMGLDADVSQVAGALRVIASHRSGPDGFILRKKAALMDCGGSISDFDVQEAYNRLQINHRTAPDETVFMYYRNLAPNGLAAGSKDSYTEALRVIGLKRESQFLLQKADDPEAKVEPTPAEPVGIDNIGNTCYLNSLLQYYYTIRPIRNMVLNFQDHRMAISQDEVLAKKRVGGRVVERKEIIKAQKFVDELHDLFMELKRSSSSSVKPTKELAELTIFSTDKEETFRRKSISSPRGPPAASLDGVMFGPQGPPPSRQLPLTPEDDIEMIDRPTDKDMDTGDTSSEATLVDMEQLPALVPATSLKSGNASEVQDFASIPEIDDLLGDAVMIDGISPTETRTFTPPQEKPPPIPPRNKSGLVISTNETKPITVDNELWRFGAQQDVTEVINNVIDRLRYAVKPTVNDPTSDEQVDIVTSTFYGASTTYTQKAQSLDSKTEAWSYLSAFPHREAVRDVYEAIDIGFEVRNVEVAQSRSLQYTSISKLPPVLQIQVQRTDWTKEKGSFKNRTHVQFPPTIHLDRYVDTEDQNSDLMRRRREIWKWKEELDILRAREAVLKNTEGGIPVGDALHSVHEYIKSLQEEAIEGIEIDLSLPEVLAERISEVEKELKDIDEQIEILREKSRTQFDDLKQYEYKIHSVFIHRGEAGGGHYWVYIHDSVQNKWREYNDDRVSEVVETGRIFHQQPASAVAGEPYFVAYVRNELQTEMVDTVCREIQSVPVDLPTNYVATNVIKNWAGNVEHEIDSDGFEKMDTAQHIEHFSPKPLRPRPVGDSNGRKGGENWPPKSADEFVQDTQDDMNGWS